MDPQYKPIYKEAQDLQFKINDAIINDNDPWATPMKNEMRALLNDMETNKNPRSVEQRMKGIEDRLRAIRSDDTEPLMNYDHADKLRRTFEQLRMKIRDFDNY
jgi:hypothetical protein